LVLLLLIVYYDMLRYERRVSWNQKQLNLAHVARQKIKKKKLKQTNASAHLIQYRFKIREGSLEGIRVTVEERICERDEF